MSSRCDYRNSLLTAYYARRDGVRVKRNKNRTISEKKRLHSEYIKDRKVKELWGEKNPTISGESCTTAQNRLSDVSNFTGYYRRRFQAEELTALAGDYYDNPVEVETLLQSRSYQELT